MYDDSQRRRIALEVVTRLRRRMEEFVTDYDEADPDGVRRVGAVIEGTAFFPGGHGLWRGDVARGPLPAYFPERAVMFVGHNFDSVLGHRRSVKRGIEVMKWATWRNLRAYIREAGLTEDACFFSNALMGLQPTGSRGGLKTTDKFRGQSQTFLAEQVRIVNPLALVPLHPVAAAMVGLLQEPRPSLTLMHPLAALRDPTLPKAQGKRLGDFLAALS